FRLADVLHRCRPRNVLEMVARTPQSIQREAPWGRLMGPHLNMSTSFSSDEACPRFLFHHFFLSSFQLAHEFMRRLDGRDFGTHVLQEFLLRFRMTRILQ